MKKLTENQQIIADDILRYKKNKLASGLALLGLVFSCLYFCVLYAMPHMSMRTISIGFSVLITLVLLLTMFLSSEGVKGYNKTYSIVLLVVAVFQIVRIFYYPLRGLKKDILTGIGYFGYYPTSSSFFFTIMVIWLVASAACLIASAVIGWIYAVRLEKFQKQLDGGEVSVEATLAKMDEEDAETALAAQTAAAEEQAATEAIIAAEALAAEKIANGADVAETSETDGEVQ